jgi:hypothetical protein
MLTSLTHSPEKYAGQQYQPDTLSSIYLSEPEEIGHQPIPEQLHKNTQYQRKRDDNGGPLYDVADNVRLSSLALGLMVVFIKHWFPPYLASLFKYLGTPILGLDFWTKALMASASCYGIGLSAYKASGILYLSVKSSPYLSSRISQLNQ